MCFRPISCYTGIVTWEQWEVSKISGGEISLEGNLKTCSYEQDVCFGKVVLTVDTVQVCLTF